MLPFKGATNESDNLRHEVEYVMQPVGYFQYSATASKTSDLPVRLASTRRGHSYHFDLTIQDSRSRNILICCLVLLKGIPFFQRESSDRLGRQETARFGAAVRVYGQKLRRTTQPTGLAHLRHLYRLGRGTDRGHWSRIKVRRSLKIKPVPVLDRAR